MLSDDFLDWILTEVRKIEHVEVIRIGSRMPVVLPYRITDDLVDMLKKPPSHLGQYAFLTIRRK